MKKTPSIKSPAESNKEIYEKSVLRKAETFDREVQELRDKVV